MVEAASLLKTDCMDDNDDDDDGDDCIKIGDALRDASYPFHSQRLYAVHVSMRLCI
jgi:hypothetical protein